MDINELNELRYVIYDYSEVDKINFNEVLETSIDTLRLSIDGTKTFDKWIGETPPCILSLTTKGPILNNQQIIEILNTPEWTQYTSGTTIN